MIKRYTNRRILYFKSGCKGEWMQSCVSVRTSGMHAGLQPCTWWDVLAPTLNTSGPVL